MAEDEGFWSDWCVFFWVRFFNLRDMLSNLFRPKIFFVDYALILLYFFKSPYRYAREMNDGEPYGETPFRVLEQIAKACPIHADDLVYELGSGRGRASLWLAQMYGCKTVAIECLPLFVERAKRVASFFHIDNVAFRLEDMLKSDLSDATWIYLFGTTLSDKTIQELIRKFERLKKGAKIITISYPLTDYTSSPKIKLVDTLELEFAWGKTQGFIHAIQ